jgi:hypothetical protein
LPHIDDGGIGYPAGGGDQPIQFRVAIEAHSSLLDEVNVSVCRDDTDAQAELVLRHSF